MTLLAVPVKVSAKIMRDPVQITDAPVSMKFALEAAFLGAHAVIHAAVFPLGLAVTSK